MPEYLVRLPLGSVRVALERRGLALSERGGFEARWAEGQGGADFLEPDAFRLAARALLSEAYREREGREAPATALNLASHQLLEDLVGWSKLNWAARLEARAKPAPPS